MRHRKKKNRLSRNLGQRKALIKSLVRSVIKEERIITTKQKAKACTPVISRLIKWAKEPTVHHRRLAYRILGDHRLVKRLFDEIAPRFQQIESGFTRIYLLNTRKGDGAQLAILELTQLKKKAGKKKVKQVSKQEPQEKKEHPPKEVPRKQPPPKGFREAIKRIFKKERDAL